MGKIQPNRRINQKHSNEYDMERLLVECAILFHSWFEQFILNDIIFNNGVIGNVENVIRYELQQHGLIHVHVILYMGPKKKCWKNYEWNYYIYIYNSKWEY